MQFDQPSTMGMKFFLWNLFGFFLVWESFYLNWNHFAVKKLSTQHLHGFKSNDWIREPIKNTWALRLVVQHQCWIESRHFFPDPATQACLCSGCTRTKQIVAGVNARVYELMFRGDFLAYIIMQIDEVHWRDAAGERATQANEAAGVRHLSFLLIMK